MTGWLGRFMFGLIGGVFLVLPMVVMLWLEAGRTGKVVTVSVSIFVFVCVMAIATRGSLQVSFCHFLLPYVP